MALTSVSQVSDSVLQGVMRSQIHQTSTQPGDPVWGLFLNVSSGGSSISIPTYTAGTGYSKDNTSTGAISIPAPTNQLHLAQIEGSFGGNAVAVPTQPFCLVDILWVVGGMGNGAATYTVTTPGTISNRWTTNELMLIHSSGTPINPANVTFTCNYLDQDGNAGSASVTGSGSGFSLLSSNGAVFLPLASGDTGVTQVTSITTNAATTGFGDSGGLFGVAVVRRVTPFLYSAYGINYRWDWERLGIPRVPSTACLSLLANAQNNAANISALRFTYADY